MGEKSIRMAEIARLAVDIRLSRLHPEGAGQGNTTGKGRLAAAARNRSRPIVRSAVRAQPALLRSMWMMAGLSGVPVSLSGTRPGQSTDSPIALIAWPEPVSSRTASAVWFQRTRSPAQPREVTHAVGVAAGGPLRSKTALTGEVPASITRTTFAIRTPPSLL